MIQIYKAPMAALAELTQEDGDAGAVERLG
jgi:hypothetical protein